VLVGARLAGERRRATDVGGSRGLPAQRESGDDGQPERTADLLAGVDQSAGEPGLLPPDAG